MKFNLVLLLMATDATVSFLHKKSFFNAHRPIWKNKEQYSRRNREKRCFARSGSVHNDSPINFWDDPALSNMEKIKYAESAHGMPWTSALQVENNVEDDEMRIDCGNPWMFYMPFWEWEIEFMKKHLTNLRIMECNSKESIEFSSSSRALDYNESDDASSRIVSLFFSSDEYRKIRLTYYENAKHGQQSFNSVWYPDASYNLPILGINLLSNYLQHKHLALIDFHPLHKHEKDHTSLFSHRQKVILERYPDYSFENERIQRLQVFSENMLCKKFTKEHVLASHIFPAFREHVRSHVDLVQSSPKRPELRDQVTERHTAYDTYSAMRDPCTGLLTTSFGKKWAHEFVFGFLYSKSQRKIQDYWPRSSDTSSPKSQDFETRKITCPDEHGANIKNETLILS